MSPQFGNCISIKYISIISELSNENKNHSNEKRKNKINTSTGVKVIFQAD